MDSSSPKTLSEIAGNGPSIAFALGWAKSWEHNIRRKPLLIYGPPGVGKTSIAHAISSQFGWELFEFNASDIRDEETVARLVGNAASSQSLFGGRRIILIDDADSLSGSSDRGGAGAIAKAISSSMHPVIITVSDLYDRKISSIKAHCEALQLRRPMPSTISALLRRLAKSDGKEITKEESDAIASSASGDVRAAVNDLAAMNFSASRDRKKSIFESVRQIFKSEKYSEARNAAFSSEADKDLLKLWVSQNIPIEYEKPFEIADAYSAVSRADIFDGRIRRGQHFGYLRYSGDLLSCGVALAKQAKYVKYSQYIFPEYISKLGATKSSRSMRAEVVKKIALACHCSLWAASDYLLHIYGAINSRPEEVASAYGFSEEEMEYLSAVSKMAGKSGGKAV